MSVAGVDAVLFFLPLVLVPSVVTELFKADVHSSSRAISRSLLRSRPSVEVGCSTKRFRVRVSRIHNKPPNPKTNGI